MAQYEPKMLQSVKFKVCVRYKSNIMSQYKIKWEKVKKNRFKKNCCCFKYYLNHLNKNRKYAKLF